MCGPAVIRQPPGDGVGIQSPPANEARFASRAAICFSRSATCVALLLRPPRRAPCRRSSAFSSFACVPCKMLALLGELLLQPLDLGGDVDQALQRHVRLELGVTCAAACCGFATSAARVQLAHAGELRR